MATHMRVMTPQTATAVLQSRVCIDGIALLSFSAVPCIRTSTSGCNTKGHAACSRLHSGHSSSAQRASFISRHTLAVSTDWIGVSLPPRGWSPLAQSSSLGSGAVPPLPRKLITDITSQLRAP